MALPDGGTQAAYNTGRTVVDPWAPFYDPYGVDANHPAVAYAKALMAENSSLAPENRWTASEAIDSAAQLYKIGPYTPEPRQGSGPVSYSSTRQAQIEAQTFEAAEAEKTRQYQTIIDKARLAAEREANLRSEMNDLRRARISERMAAR